MDWLKRRIYFTDNKTLLLSAEDCDYKGYPSLCNVPRQSKNNLNQDPSVVNAYLGMFVVRKTWLMFQSSQIVLLIVQYEAL